MNIAVLVNLRARGGSEVMGGHVQRLLPRARVALTRSVMLVSGLEVESVEQIEAEGMTGISIVQVLSTGQRVVLEEFPTDTVGAAGEIGVTGIPPDTVVGHVRMADLEIRIKGVGIPEDRIVQFPQDLVEVKP